MNVPQCFVVRLCTLAGFTALGLVLLTAPAAAQTLTNAFGGMSASSKEPIDIESDVLVVHDAEKYATFKGNVKAVQGTTTLRSRELDVHYVGKTDKVTGGSAKQRPTKTADSGTKGAALGGNGTKITKIEARGDVIITSKDDQTTTSDWALYDVATQMVTVGGNVVLTQGENVLKGDRLIIDLKTGESRFEPTGDTAAGKRIRALFVPKADSKAKAKSSKKKPDGAAAPDGQPAAPAAPAAPDAPAEETTGDGWPAAPAAEETGADAAANADTAVDAAPQDLTPWQLVPESQR